MIALRIERWAAWSPGREDALAWRRWCAAPEPLAAEGRPEARFLPSLLRRRCSVLTRIMLTAAFACCDDARDRVATVFASRHGNLNESIELLERLAREQPISPTRFSHTVHNAQAGLFSIATGNRAPSSSISAREDTFACGWIEASTLLERSPDRPVLLVVGDVPLAAAFSDLVDEPAASYGVAFLLGAREGDREGLELRLGSEGPARSQPWPDALEFLRWYRSGEERLVLGSGRRRFGFSRRRPLAA